MARLTTCRLILALSFVTIIIGTLLTDGVEGRGARGGGGFRGGSRGSSYRASSYRGSSSRSSYSSGTTFTARSGSRTTSSYVRSYQTARYTRAYLSRRSYYTSYYSQYFIFARTPAYRSRSQPSDDVDVCVNYEANDNDTYLGVFTCPLDFEPANFTQCCGSQYAEFCCTANSAGSPYFGISMLVGSLIMAALSV